MNILFEKVLHKAKRHTLGPELSMFRKYRKYFENKVGIEIGGPSGIFGRNEILPLYPLAERVDGVNYSTETVWENEISAGRTYAYSQQKLGYQYILEATNLSEIADDQYDFLLSSHSLEHCANPLKAVLEWKRVIRTGGVVLLVLPDKRYTFDHRREVTSFDHLKKDYIEKIQENDLTHFDEIIQLHDIVRDPGIESTEQFIERSKMNHENRCLHHHVFSLNLVRDIFSYVGMDTLFTKSSVLNMVSMAIKK